MGHVFLRAFLVCCMDIQVFPARARPWMSPRWDTGPGEAQAFHHASSALSRGEVVRRPDFMGKGFAQGRRRVYGRRRFGDAVGFEARAFGEALSAFEGPISSGPAT